IAGTVVDARGAPLPGFHVAVQSLGADGVQWRTTDRDGRFAVHLREARPCLVRAFAAAEGAAQVAAAVARGVMPGTEDLVLRVADEALPSATITGSVRSAAGEVPARALVSVWSEDRLSPVGQRVDRVHGTFTVGPLPPGRYRL